MGVRKICDGPNTGWGKTHCMEHCVREHLKEERAHVDFNEASQMRLAWFQSDAKNILTGDKAT